MRVAHLKDGQFSVDEVPDDWIQCSVSHEYRPREEFCDPNGVQVRTNCERTYQMSGMGDYKALCSRVVDCATYKEKLRDFHKEQELIRESVSVEDMIGALKQLPKGSRLCVLQEGYYASGQYADIYFPELHKEVDNVEFYSLGFSSQNY